MNKRVYRLQLDDHKESIRCTTCELLGLVAPFKRLEEDFQRSLKKLNNDLIGEVMMPCFASKHPHYNDLAQQILKTGKKVNQVTHTASNNSGLFVTEDITKCNQLSDRDMLVVLNKNAMNVKQVSDVYQKYQGNVYFYAPLKTKLREDKLSIKKVYKFIKKMKALNCKVTPYPGLGVFETRAPIDLDFEPYPVNSVKKNEQIIFSIIIPVFEQKKYILRVLDSLEKQDFDLDTVEIIIIDDGGSDLLNEELKKRNSKISTKYHYLHREVHRTMGDFRFRAGIARNLGAKMSSGKYFLFLDADVLLPDNALSQMAIEIKETTLLQIKRYDLHKSATDNYKDVASIDGVHDIIYEGRDYWYDFFKKGNDWSHLKNSWKYICTYGLCIRSEDFKNYGGFQNNYIGYGFEDTDLGFRVFQNKGTFKLSSVIGYHQYHSHERSEFKNSHYKRSRVLSRTAKVFFLNNLSTEIFEDLRDYM